MRILFAAQELAGFFDNPAKQVRVNGAILFDSVTRPRASATAFYARGNEANTIAFSVRRKFGTVKDCEAFLLLHFAGLTKEGTAKIECGLSADDITAVWYPGALLTATQSGFGGTSCEIQYTIMAGRPQLTDPS